jgi:hypothetical protein
VLLAQLSLSHLFSQRDDLGHQTKQVSFGNCFLCHFSYPQFETGSSLVEEVASKWGEEHRDNFPRDGAFQHGTSLRTGSSTDCSVKLIDNDIARQGTMAASARLRPV